MQNITQPCIKASNRARYIRQDMLSNWLLLVMSGNNNNKKKESQNKASDAKAFKCSRSIRMSYIFHSLQIPPSSCHHILLSLCDSNSSTTVVEIYYKSSTFGRRQQSRRAIKLHKLSFYISFVLRVYSLYLQQWHQWRVKNQSAHSCLGRPRSRILRPRLVTMPPKLRHPSRVQRRPHQSLRNLRRRYKYNIYLTYIYI